jgi:enterochelin esterase-like enzyme
MKGNSLVVAILFGVATIASAQLPQVSSGRLVRHASFSSKFVTSRNVDVWLPDGYDGKKPFDVLYMHDGQMLYDSNTTWNKTDWQVDETLSKLLASKKIRPCIVVGVWNGGVTRHPDYFPQKPFGSMSSIEKDTVTAQLQRARRTQEVFHPNSDNYLQFLVKELKPFIDSAYKTNSGQAHTFVAGSSMGGLISMYAICEYPEVFGGAACLSTHWPGVFTMENNPVPAAFFNYLKTHLPSPRNHKIYFDYGDQTLDALYPPLQRQADAIMKAKGYDSKNWKTVFFEGQNHSEQAWASRFDIPILFLLGK